MIIWSGGEPAPVGFRVALRGAGDEMPSRSGSDAEHPLDQAKELGGATVQHTGRQPEPPDACLPAGEATPAGRQRRPQAGTAMPVDGLLSESLVREEPSPEGAWRGGAEEGPAQEDAWLKWAEEGPAQDARPEEAEEGPLEEVPGGWAWRARHFRGIQIQFGIVAVVMVLIASFVTYLCVELLPSWGPRALWLVPVWGMCAGVAAHSRRVIFSSWQEVVFATEGPDPQVHVTRGRRTHSFPLADLQEVRFRLNVRSTWLYLRVKGRRQPLVCPRRGFEGDPTDLFRARLPGSVKVTYVQAARSPYNV